MLVEFAIVSKVVVWRVNQEFDEAKLCYQDVSNYTTKFGDAPSDALISDKDLQSLDFGTKFRVLLSKSAVKVIGITGGLFLVGLLVGFLIASVTFRHIVDLGERLGKLSTMDKLAGFLGLLIGLLISAIFVPYFMKLFSMPPDNVGTALVVVVITYLCIAAALGMKAEMVYYFPSLSHTHDSDMPFQHPKILDTNVVIDGRVSDICRSGFIEGTIMVPAFVLEELQHIADSSDSLRRARGRRGLDILNQMRNELGLVVRPNDGLNSDSSEEVDIRLVKMAKQLDAAIITNDFNLNKVAELQGVTVLNINELANALKPVVLPGEEMTLSVVKEGKEYNQGIAYLDDGTMIVIEGGRKCIGETVDVMVTSVLQTVAGKMIFANLKEAQREEDELIDRNVRSYSSFRPRKKA
jgi:uncharacterized protein YacL